MRVPASVALFLALPVSAQTGLVPLPDMDAGSTHLGFPGGLYPGAQNVPPPAHLAAALAESAKVLPRDPAGAPHPQGRVGLVSIGMSNTAHEFGRFERQADLDSDRAARLYVLNCALGGQSAEVTSDPDSSYWELVDGRVAAAGLTAAQVQVAWLKNSHSGPTAAFPEHAEDLRADLEQTARNLRTRFPNLRLCYLSSRTYGGYSSGTLNPEPYAYESGFAVKWMIERQIDGAAELNWDPTAGPVEAPLLLWGPYIWADGATPSGAGLAWLPEDFEGDGVHPSPAGEEKVAALLSEFLASDETASSWYRTSSAAVPVGVEATDDTFVSGNHPTESFGLDPALRTGAQPGTLVTYVRFDLTDIALPIMAAKLSFRAGSQNGGDVRTLHQVDDTAWTQSSLTFENAPLPGPALTTIPRISRDGSLSADVTQVVKNDADGVVAFALQDSTTVGYLRSDESGEPPRLVLTLPHSPAVTLYGCGVNPQGSLRVLSGAPALGSTLTLGVDDPGGATSPGAPSFLAIATAPDPAFPCGTVLTGWGLGGSAAPGELLLSVAPPDPVLVLTGPPWSGPPAPFALFIPPSPGLAGDVVFIQGVLVAADGLGLTAGARVEILP